MQWLPVMYYQSTPVVFSTHLTNNEHVLAPDDALLHLGAQSLTNFHFILVAVGSVYVAVASCNGSLHCTLDCWPRRQLQQEQHFNFF